MIKSNSNYNKFSCNIIRHIATLSDEVKSGTRWTKEINFVSYNGKEPKYDIRGWREDGDGEKVMLKGLTLDADEARELKIALEGEV